MCFYIYVYCIYFLLINVVYLKNGFHFWTGFIAPTRMPRHEFYYSQLLYFPLFLQVNEKNCGYPIGIYLDAYKQQ